MALQKANGIDPRLDVDAWENILMGQRIRTDTWVFAPECWIRLR